MTIDNVLEILEKHKLHIPSNVFYELKADIVNFEEPTTKNDLGVDCISRAEAIRVASGYCHPSNVAKELAKLPSVTPQEHKGHWNDIPKYKDIAWQCSECGRFTTMKHNYCPLCGAKMVEPRESEDKQ